LFFRALQRLAIIVFMSSVNPRKRTMDGVKVELQHSPPRREFRSRCMMRWIFRLIVMAVAAKVVNRFSDRATLSRGRAARFGAFRASNSALAASPSPADTVQHSQRG
jgi:uncharacterized protein YifN (PemK superfamily)